jgi:hypothetical protein
VSVIEKIPNLKKIRRSIWSVLTVFILLCFLQQSAIGGEKYSILIQNHGAVASPLVILQSGTAGTSMIYMNSTSAKVSIDTSTPTYDYVLKIVNQESDTWKIRLNAHSQSNIGRLNNCTAYFHNSTDGTSSQIAIINGSYTQQTGPWYDLSALETAYMAVTLQASGSEESVLFVYLEILTPNRTTYAQYVLTFIIT